LNWARRTDSVFGRFGSIIFEILQPPPTWPAPPSEGTAEVAARVAQARRLQIDRAEAMEGAPSGAEALNGRAEGRFLEAIADLDDAGRGLLARAAEAGQISARGWTRVLRLARTIADLEGAASVRRVHVAEALAHRRTSAPGAAVGEAAF
jgi:magnesium chelatase family protein